jgi:lipoprotein-releasing system ATP-binding protein
MPQEIEILHGIDLVLEPAAFCALIGPSGSGKSTLLNIIGLLDRQTSGRLTIGGEDTQDLDDAGLTRLRGRRIGFVFQAHNLISAFTAAENVLMPILVDRTWPDAAMRRTAEELLDKVGMTKWRDNRVSSLSGGQAQRVAIARALAMSPTLVLADEPTGNLDTAAADSVFDLLRAMNRQQGVTFLIVTHDPRLAARCDRIVELVDGRVRSDITTHTDQAVLVPS